MTNTLTALPPESAANRGDRTHNSLMRAVAAFTLACLLGSVVTIAAASDMQHLPGQVVRVVDGDTLVLEVSGGRHRVRLAGIDAPERNQPWGEASTRELRRMVAGRHVVVDWEKKDRWKRIIGVVRLADEDVNLHMVDRGMAWHFKRYAADQSPAMREEYAAAETEAREARRGLWSDPDPIPPWEWRKRGPAR